MCTFSEFVAYSQRERWFFDSENFSSIHGKLLDSDTVACESAGEEIPTCGVESDHRWEARELVVKTEGLISIFDEVDDDGGGSEEGCGKRLMRRLKLKSTTSRLGRAATSCLPPPQIHDWPLATCHGS
ncbi:hypothetical protein FF1_031651 [Malus domestica]